MPSNPLVDCKAAILAVALFSGTDVRRTLQLSIGVCRSWQQILSIKVSPILWKLHAAETADRDHKLLINAASKNLPHLVDILLTKFIVLPSDIAASAAHFLPSVSAADAASMADAASVALETSVSEEFRANEPLMKAQPLKGVADVDKRTPLMFMARFGHVDIARRLIVLGCDVNAKDNIISVGSTALHRAAEAGHLEMCQLLIDSGADVFAKDDSNWTPLFNSIHKGHLQCAELLVKNMFGEAAQKNEEIKSAAKYFVDFSDENGCTILHHAALSGNVPVWNFAFNLIDVSAEEKIKILMKTAEPVKSTVLHSAALSGSSQMVATIIKAFGVKISEVINAKDSDGDTALILAGRNGYAQSVKELLAAGADDSIRNDKGETVLDATHSKASKTSEGKIFADTARVIHNHQKSCGGFCC